MPKKTQKRDAKRKKGKAGNSGWLDVNTAQVREYFKWEIKAVEIFMLVATSVALVVSITARFSMAETILTVVAVLLLSAVVGCIIAVIWKLHTI